MNSLSILPILYHMGPKLKQPKSTAHTPIITVCNQLSFLLILQTLLALMVTVGLSLFSFVALCFLTITVRASYAGQPPSLGLQYTLIHNTHDLTNCVDLCTPHGKSPHKCTRAVNRHSYTYNWEIQLLGTRWMQTACLSSITPQVTVK